MTATASEADDVGLPLSLRRAAPLFADGSAIRAAARAVFPGDGGGRFLVYLDDACGMPSDWRANVHSRRDPNASEATSSRGGDSEKATTLDAKYAAESLLPHMLLRSGHATSSKQPKPLE